MRPTRPFRDLLLEALAAVQRKDLTALTREAFFEEVRRHLNRLPEGEDRVARALRLGREALYALALGSTEEACGKLREALGLHPFLGGGHAARLAEVLCGEGVAAELVRQGEPLIDSSEGLMAARVLAFLDALPPEFWGEVLRGPRRTSPREGRAPRPSRPERERRPPLPPSRPRFPLTYQARYREESPEEGVWKAELITPFGGKEAFGPKELRRWVGSGLEIREEKGGRFRLYLLPEFWERHPGAALLVLEGRGAQVFIPLLPHMPSLPFPRVFRRGEEVVGEVWSWEDMTPRTLAAFLREVHPYRGLLWAWLEYGVGTGRMSPETLWKALRLLEEDR